MRLRHLTVLLALIVTATTSGCCMHRCCHRHPLRDRRCGCWDASRYEPGGPVYGGGPPVLALPPGPPPLGAVPPPTLLSPPPGPMAAPMPSAPTAAASPYRYLPAR